MFFTFLRAAAASACLVVLGACFSSPTSAATNPSFELDSRTLERAGAPIPVAAPVSGKRSRSRHSVRTSVGSRKHGAHGRQRAVRAFQAPVHALRLGAPSAELSGPETTLRVTDLLSTLVPQAIDVRKPLVLQSAAFALTLDPQRYPVFSAMDGAKIVLDPNASIPALVKTLIMERDPSVRIVSESPGNSRRFLETMLNAAGFYSLETSFSMDFGVDPRLRVHSDFKVEKTSDSLMKQDVALINSGRDALPPALTAFLKKDGFTTYEPFASQKAPVVTVPPRSVIQVSDKNCIDVTDAILNALSVAFQNDYPVGVFAEENNGISLSVKAQRYFERDGQHFVISGFDGDPVSYTLFRILETKGYRVVILDKHDDFRKVSEKLFTALRLRSRYAQHAMWPETNSSYSVRMSGFRLEGAGIPGGSLFLTNLQIDRIIRDLLVENGYDVRDK
jgi:hypothetical protein